MDTGKEKRWLHTAVLLLLLLLLTQGACAEETPATDREEAEWTVLIYICGADLESRLSYASGSLKDIADCIQPTSLQTSLLQETGEEGKNAPADYPGVNVVLQTGGCRKWHAESLGMDIAADKLQRWEVKPRTIPGLMENPNEPVFFLQEELPLDNMASASVLRDFIRWGTARYPARKYMLFLWGHGGGSKNGVLLDELFDGNMMSLTDLHDALAEAGVRMESILFDACMMANIETAYMVKDYAHWMVASEEVVAGQGSAVGSWLQQLYLDPEVDGRRLGTWICDMTQILYSDVYDQAAGSLMTWSVIDLTKIDRVGTALNRFFRAACKAYTESPSILRVFMNAIHRSEEYGNGQDNMYDLFGVFYDSEISKVMNPVLRREMLDALSDAVVYAVRGTGRNAARGLSFCYAADFSKQELDTYARNCPSPSYQALLDAANSFWIASEEVYQQEGVEHLKPFRSLEEYRIVMEKQISLDGMPGVILISGENGYHDTFYRLYRRNEAYQENVSMGSFRTIYETTADGNTMMRANEPWMWPAIQGIPCSMEMIQQEKEAILSEIPVQIGSDFWMLRCGYLEGEGYKIYGLWDGYDADSSSFSRNVMSMNQFAGSEFRLVYPVEIDYQSIIDQAVSGEKYNESARMAELMQQKVYEYSKPLTVYRTEIVEEVPLEPGTYYLQYVVRDIFLREIPMERLVMEWDGQKAVFPGLETWTGTEVINWNGYPMDQLNYITATGDVNLEEFRDDEYGDPWNGITWEEYEASRKEKEE